MNKCDEIIELASLDLDDELAGAARERVSRHLADCPECARLVGEFRAVDRLLRGAPMKMAPAGFTARAVDAAFEDALRRNVNLGLLSLLIGTIVISSIILLGYVGLLWSVTAILLAPGFFANGSLWLPEALQGLSVAASVGLTVLEILRNLLLGPLLVPSLMAILAAVFLGIVLRQEGRSLTRAASNSGALFF
ncbi:MAG: anti-sigma factor family protein [Ardenticatenaceae bacterium]